MSILETLTLSDTSKRNEITDPVVHLRRKMAGALDIQIAAATAAQKGETYTLEVEKWVLTDQVTGAKERQKVSKAVRKMWFTDASDRIMVELRFGNKPIKVNNKSSIVVGTMDKLVPTLQTIRKAVLQGELDVVLKTASDSRKRTLKLPKAGAAQVAKTTK